MITKEDFEKLLDHKVIGSIVGELQEAWESCGCPAPKENSPTTELPTGVFRGSGVDYWTDYESEDEIWARYYNDMLDVLLELIDVRNIASSNNPIWYTSYYRDVIFNEYFDKAIRIIADSNLYDMVCQMDAQELRDAGYYKERLKWDIYSTN